MVAIAGETRLVTTAARAECFLRGHVADRIVGQRDREGEGKLAAGLQIQAELAKVLRGTGQEHGWPNLHRLHLDLNVRRGRSGHQGARSPWRRSMPFHRRFRDSF